MKIYAIRHGITELNKKKILNGQIDEPLSPEGIKQAEEAIQDLPKTINYIYTSPMIRAKKTAEVINNKLSKPLLIEESVTEIHMGSIAGNSWDSLELGSQLKAKHRAVQFDYSKLGGESAQQVKKRVIKFLKNIKDKHKDTEVLLVTHGGIIRILHFLEHGEGFTEDVGHISPKLIDVSKILKSNS